MSIADIIFRFMKKKENKEYDCIRTERVYIRMTPDEKEIIEAMAKHQHRDTANFIRWLALEKYLNDFIKTN